MIIPHTQNLDELFSKKFSNKIILQANAWIPNKYDAI